MALGELPELFEESAVRLAAGPKTLANEDGWKVLVGRSPASRISKRGAKELPETSPDD